MGTSNSTLGKTSTAHDVVLTFSGPESLVGHFAIVTGGASGIGTETVKALASAGCRVLLGCRNVSAGEAVVREMTIPGISDYDVPRAIELVTVVQLDLEDLSSVRSFAEVACKEARLDYIVLNAGIMAVPELTLTKYGWERQMATNHFGISSLSRYFC